MNPAVGNDAGVELGVSSSTNNCPGAVGIAAIQDGQGGAVRRRRRGNMDHRIGGASRREGIDQIGAVGRAQAGAKVIVVDRKNRLGLPLQVLLPVVMS